MALKLASLKRKLLKPCRKIVHLLFNLRRRKPLSIKPPHRRRKPAAAASPRRISRFSKLTSLFRLKRGEREMDRVTEFTSFSDQKAPHPSPLTPAYVRMTAKGGAIVSDDRRDDVEDACRSFETYLIDMIVDEGKMRDLADVEELLYCWRELRSPVFVDLVCRFYRELCTDLFSNQLN